MKQIHFFALKADILSLLETVEHDYPIKYVRTGNFLKGVCETFLHGAEIPDLGQPNADSASGSQSFLVTRRTLPIDVRRIQTQNGDRYCVDQMVNPDTIEFTPGGIRGGDVVLNGRFATASNSAIAQELMKRFHSEIRKRFAKIKAFSVGPEAFDLLKHGKRLTASIHSPHEYDLTIDSQPG